MIFQKQFFDSSRAIKVRPGGQSRDLLLALNEIYGEEQLPVGTRNHTLVQYVSDAYAYPSVTDGNNLIVQGVVPTHLYDEGKKLGANLVGNLPAGMSDIMAGLVAQNYSDATGMTYFDMALTNLLFTVGAYTKGENLVPTMTFMLSERESFPVPAYCIDYRTPQRGATLTSKMSFARPEAMPTVVFLGNEMFHIGGKKGDAFIMNAVGRGETVPFKGTDDFIKILNNDRRPNLLGSDLAWHEGTLEHRLLVLEPFVEDLGVKVDVCLEAVLEHLHKAAKTAKQDRQAVTQVPVQVPVQTQAPTQTVNVTVKVEAPVAETNTNVGTTDNNTISTPEVEDDLADMW